MGLDGVSFFLFLLFLFFLCEALFGYWVPGTSLGFWAWGVGCCDVSGNRSVVLGRDNCSIRASLA
jgi:hypothetical protein